MLKLQVNGTEICISELTQRPFRAIPCQLLLTVTSRNKTKALTKLKRVGELGAYDGLRISGISDLSFLKDFPLLLYLEIIDQKNVNTRYLDGLDNLRGLRLHTPGAGIDFACFPMLEVFVGDWHPENRNLDQSRELRRLHIWRFNPRSMDLSDLGNSVRLEELNIVQTNIASLTGVERLEDLRYLEIDYSPKLESLDALRSGDSGIRELSLSNAKAIRSYLPLASVRYLRRLKLSRCAPMSNLKWMRGLDELDMFTFAETNVEDGDLSPLLSLPKLRDVGTMDKRHYNYKCNALNELLSKRGSSNAATPGGNRRSNRG